MKVRNPIFNRTSILALVFFVLLSYSYDVFGQRSRSLSKVFNSVSQSTSSVSRSTSRATKASFSLPSSSYTTSSYKATSSVPSFSNGTSNASFVKRVLPNNSTSPTLKTSNSTPITGYTRHGQNQKMNRNVKSKDVVDALKKPIKVNPVKYDQLQRPSQRYIGKNTEVAVNPNSGKILSTNPTSSSKVKRLTKGG